MPRKCLENAYSTVVRTTLEYASAFGLCLWGTGCSPPKVNSVSGWKSDNMHDEVYSQSKCSKGTTSTRHDVASLQIMHHIVNEAAQAHLQTLKPNMCSEIQGASTRKATCKTLDQTKV